MVSGRATQRALVVHPDPGLRESLSRLLTEAGRIVGAAPIGRDGLKRALEDPPDLVLLGERPSDESLAFLRSYRSVHPHAPVVVLADNGDDGLMLLREGAYDRLCLPVRPEELGILLNRVEEREQLRREVDALRAAVSSTSADDLVVADSQAMRDLLGLAARSAMREGPVLLLGETGTGRETLARAVHRMGPRRAGLFVPVNCGALTETELRAEVLGEPGSRTPPRLLAAAEGGTLFLRELDALPACFHDRLRDLLARRPETGITRSGVRLIASSTAPLPTLESAFEAVLTVPPLRERREDIPGLVTHFLREAAERLGRPISLTPQAMAMLAEEHWSGNVTELARVIDRATALSGARRLDSADFLPHLAPADPKVPRETTALASVVQKVEREAILRALDLAKGNRREAARLLGISLRTLFYKLRRLRLD